jgi:4-hydroxy-2-oxoheptanedioate aldolase
MLLLRTQWVAKAGAAFFCACLLSAQPSKTAAWTPRRVNKCIELLEMGQPIYYTQDYGGYEEGKKLAKTWADYITYDMENNPLDFRLLHEFMRGLVDGGPTPSGHRTPAVIVVLPVYGTDAATIDANAWMVQQALLQGVHGIILPRARGPEAVKHFVRAVRYPFQKQELNVLGYGTRGWGSQNFAATIWGIDSKQYLQVADAWPLNPKGEILLGVRIEDWQALENAEKTLAVPGIAFAEHGPRDMGLSYGYLDGRADPPVPKEVEEAGKKVLALCKKYHVAFLDNVLPENVEQRIREGVRIGAGRRQDSAEKGRRYTKRPMPW